MPTRRLALILAATGLVACHDKAPSATQLPTTTATRANISVRVQATGILEPIDPVDIKSKAEGMITQLPVDVGSVVKSGQLLVQVDPRDVQNDFNQALGDDLVATAAFEQALKQGAREDALFARHVITVSEHDSTGSTVVSAKADLAGARADLDLARQKLEDATVHAPIKGTVISRPVTQGTIISSAVSASGGTTLMTLADLDSVRMRVSIDEVEMANVRVGQTATVAVDAFPDHVFEGVVGKVEPQATVTQGVTFFPVLVNVDNKEGLLMPGMNGEVTIKSGDLSNVLQVPIDAIRPTNQLAPVARMFSIPVDTLMSEIRRDLVSGEETTGVPGRYVIVQLSDSTYEMRLIKTGPTDLRVTEIRSGLNPGDKVVVLGAIMTGRPAVPPKLIIADDLKRGAPAAHTAQADPAKATPAKAAAATSPPAKAGVEPTAKAAPPGKATKP
ncbi:MAG TPA: efflux RND transporter periplasmic adaptor subunit [Gemmatimonadaceae bacterium]|nr:efflux RND transporter periplasmic adaptor subunit [Gemmatimonadaceae bacterium]